MPMNEYGEIVRSGSQSHHTESPPRAEDTFTYNVRGQFAAARKRNFNLITLGVSIPLYAIIGYFVADHFWYMGSTGMIVGAIAALICTLIYNNSMAVLHEGHEYVLSILSTGIVLVILGIAIGIIVGIAMILWEILKVVLAGIVVIAVLGGLFGG